MEEELTEAYNSTLRTLVEGMEAAGNVASCRTTVTPGAVGGAAPMSARNLFSHHGRAQGATHRRAGSR